MQVCRTDSPHRPFPDPRMTDSVCTVHSAYSIRVCALIRPAVINQSITVGLNGGQTGDCNLPLCTAHPA